ncbi:EAL domain-containing protein [Exilibacterium tricleocarpae]|uniref:EAL domain-containing protein n=1 Tax=Exilibacterium tricleocarpae TaxID=2591008 RepID=A0A545SY53_9GAMM|nr:EAL domain-containing protein [Exilibacterium tricleocarpae]TQV69894.1 EAL domain-containing protein [Exilibacterium tricleocarpae]
MKKSFLSLKWQAVLSVSFILVLGVGLITYFGKNNLEQTYVNQRDRVFQDRQKAVAGALQAMQLQLLQLAGHMQGLAGATEEGVGSADALRRTLEYNWDQLNFEWDVDAMVLYNTVGSVIDAWGGGVPAQALSAQWVAEANRVEAPVTEIWCDRSCWQTVSVPVFLNTSTVGVLSLTRSLAGAVLQFHDATLADVGILVPRRAGAAEPLESMWPLGHWQHDLVALTGAPLTYNVLEQMSSGLPIAELARARAIQVWENRHYEISLIPLGQTSDAKGARMVVLEDVSADVGRLQSTLAGFFLAAIAILLLAEAVLLWLLWLPMVRLQVVAKALPLLAQSNRDMTLNLTQLRGPRLIRNEIHDLFDAAILLSRKLERLDLTVKSRTKGLKRRSRELLEERNFVTTLLNNVHVVILTQDRHRRLRLLNTEGQRLTGVAKNGLQHVRFTDYIEDDQRGEIERGIEALFAGTASQFHHESDFISDSGKRLHMDWYHSHLPNTNAEDSLVLSVGLDLTARKIAERNLAWLADHDPLTELFNRRRFQTEFAQALKKYDRFKQPGALVFFDVDQFKTVNDASGHPAGDRLLCEIAVKLAHAVRDTDTLARLGGDEFAVLMEQTNRDGAIALANKLCELISDTEVIGNKTLHRITISVGIALYPEHGESVDELMANADFAMYKSKAESNARSNWHLYSADAPERYELQKRVDWKARIKDALDDGRLLLHYQPILDVSGNCISHYESLVRMVDERGELVPPGMFIQIAEKTGLIHEIDRYVVNMAVAALDSFRRQGRDITLSVNLSAKAIANSDFVATIEGLVKAYNIDRSHLIFELTETSAVEDIVTAAEVIGRCCKLGYKFALDDFGVGFASWFYLRRLPVDYVKIDGSFVRHLAKNFEDRLFVKAINDVAQGLGKKTIAEFVEDEIALELLTKFGVDYAQGYFIGKPQPSLLPSDQKLAGIAPAEVMTELNTQ